MDSEIITPSPRKIFGFLLQSDFIVQWRNRRASILTLVVPLVILISWKQVAAHFGGAFVLASCITFGLVAIGLMSYSNTTARDREKGVFQRLRATPASTAAIMGSRLTVQLVQMLVMAIVTFAAGYWFDHIALGAGQYLLALLVTLVGAALYLGLGQAIVGLIASAETVNAVARVAYFAFIVVGSLGQFGVLGKIVSNIVTWSPYGTVKDILVAAMQPGGWTNHAWLALAVTLGYAIIFASVGIKRFEWKAA